MKKIFLLAILIAAIFVFSGDEIEDEVYTAYGSIVKTAKNSIVIKEYNIEIDTEADYTYTITADTVFSGFESIKDLKVGDSLSIDYTLVNSERIAAYIYLEEVVEENIEYDEDEY